MGHTQDSGSHASQPRAATTSPSGLAIPLAMLPCTAMHLRRLLATLLTLHRAAVCQLPAASLDAQMTFLGSERAAESAVAWRELGIVGVWAEVEVGVWAEVDVEPRGILFTYGSTYWE